MSLDGTALRLRLYVTGHTVSAENARTAVDDLVAFVAQTYTRKTVSVEVVDVLETPEIAARDGIFATPTLMRLLPGPRLRLFGDLSCPSNLIARLGLNLPLAPLLPQGEDAASCQDPIPLTPTSSSPAPVQG